MGAFISSLFLLFAHGEVYLPQLNKIYSSSSNLSLGPAFSTSGNQGYLVPLEMFLNDQSEIQSAVLLRSLAQRSAHPWIAFFPKNISNPSGALLAVQKLGAIAAIFCEADDKNLSTELCEIPCGQCSPSDYNSIAFCIRCLFTNASAYHYAIAYTVADRGEFSRQIENLVSAVIFGFVAFLIYVFYCNLNEYSTENRARFRDVYAYHLLFCATKTEVASIPQYIAAAGEDRCPICLDAYKMGDECRLLPCCHNFHLRCIDEWLLTRYRSCPICFCDIRRFTKSGGR